MVTARDELEIPEASLTALVEVGYNAHPDDSDEQVRSALRRIAAPVVAAELRRIAESADQRYRPFRVGWAVEESTAHKRMGVELVLRDLFARADELESGRTSREGERGE